MLQKQVRRDSQALKDFLAPEAPFLLVDFKKDSSYAARLKHHLSGGKESLKQNLDVWAKTLGFSVSSLRRKLREEGWSYQNLRETIRSQRSVY